VSLIGSNMLHIGPNVQGTLRGRVSYTRERK